MCATWQWSREHQVSPHKVPAYFKVVERTAFRSTGLLGWSTSMAEVTGASCRTSSVSRWSLCVPTGWTPSWWRQWRGSGTSTRRWTRFSIHSVTPRSVGSSGACWAACAMGTCPCRRDTACHAYTRNACPRDRLARTTSHFVVLSYRVRSRKKVNGGVRPQSRWIWSPPPNFVP